MTERTEVNADKTRPATADDWPNLKPLAGRIVSLSLGMRFTSAEMDNIRLGFVPMEMEFKWFAYFENDVLHMHRSWTGYKVAEVPFSQDGDHWITQDARVAFDEEFFTATYDEAATYLTTEIRFYASGDAQHIHQSGISMALGAVCQPNYLGTPSVMFSLLSDLFQLTINNTLRPYSPDLPPASYQDVQAANQHICAVLCGEVPGYQGLEGWRTKAGLGEAVITAFGLEVSRFADENLGCILSVGLSGITTKIRETLQAWLRDGATDPNEMISVLRNLQGFVSSVLMGTNSVHYPGALLADFAWTTEGTEVEAVVEENPPQSFHTLLRQLLEETRIETSIEDHNPEDEEETDQDADANPDFLAKK